MQLEKAYKISYSYTKDRYHVHTPEEVITIESNNPQYKQVKSFLDKSNWIADFNKYNDLAIYKSSALNMSNILNLFTYAATDEVYFFSKLIDQEITLTKVYQVNTLVGEDYGNAESGPMVHTWYEPVSPNLNDPQEVLAWLTDNPPKYPNSMSVSFHWIDTTTYDDDIDPDYYCPFHELGQWALMEEIDTNWTIEEFNAQYKPSSLDMNNISLDMNNISLLFFVAHVSPVLLGRVRPGDTIALGGYGGSRIEISNKSFMVYSITDKIGFKDYGFDSQLPYSDTMESIQAHVSEITRAGLIARDLVWISDLRNIPVGRYTIE